MSALSNPADSYERVSERAGQDDPWVMYYAVRKDVPLSLEQAMSLAGAGAVLCDRRFRVSPEHGEAFIAWHAESFRKVALRCKPSQLERLAAEEDAVTITAQADAGEPVLLCLPPRRRSQASPLLRKLQVYTDAPTPEAEPAGPADPLATYVIRPEVMKSAGKAMAQAGHAAVMLDNMLGSFYGSELEAWIGAGARGRLLSAGDEQWELLKNTFDCVVVRDAGLTQVESGTETVLALPPVEGLHQEITALLDRTS
jgi:peptidyl-tRNA hydrolase